MSEPFAAIEQVINERYHISQTQLDAARAELEAARELLAATVEVLSADSAGRKNEIAHVDSMRLKVAIAALSRREGRSLEDK